MEELSIVIPTYNEAGNIPELVRRLKIAFPQSPIIVVDDKSPDGTAKIAEGLGCRVIVRDERGLGTAIIDGLCAAETDYVLTMDADLSHRPEDAPKLIESLNAGYDLVVGSRFVKGGVYKTTLMRRIITFIGVLPAYWCTNIHDTGTGFFAVNKRRVNVEGLKPISWKALLEIYARNNGCRVKEIPIIFEKRFAGYSKSTVKYFMFNVLHFFMLLFSLTLPKIPQETDGD